MVTLNRHQAEEIADVIISNMLDKLNNAVRSDLQTDIRRRHFKEAERLLEMVNILDSNASTRCNLAPFRNRMEQMRKNLFPYSPS